MQLSQLDHLVLTVTDMARTRDFYVRVLGMEAITFGAADTPRHALAFGTQKINLHQAGKEFEPKAAHPLPGSADLCFLTTTPLTEVIAHLTQVGQPILEGPVQRTGAQGSILSVYIRDPDGNLLEIANQLATN
ncbi:VOC family protein [Parvibium lacunae]|uniref:VOC family protein n=1 Tax=Parvibium lacunae TaxID=1888893 RepID=A0A368KYY6_9BURK|nr:VOC family protein [Parvibium lacunae]RCS56603.1 VOC family protein [Parvibium lacunae]